LFLVDQVTLQSSWATRLEDCKVRKNRQGRQERQGNEVKNNYFHRLVLFFLGDLGALGGSKIDFAVLLGNAAGRLPMAGPMITMDSFVSHWS